MMRKRATEAWAARKNINVPPPFFLCRHHSSLFFFLFSFFVCSSDAVFCGESRDHLQVICLDWFVSDLPDWFVRDLPYWFVKTLSTPLTSPHPFRLLYFSNQKQLKVSDAPFPTAGIWDTHSDSAIGGDQYGKAIDARWVVLAWVNPCLTLHEIASLWYFI